MPTPLASCRHPLGRIRAVARQPPAHPDLPSTGKIVSHPGQQALLRGVCLACRAAWVPCFHATTVAGKHAVAPGAHAHRRLRRVRACHPPRPAGTPACSVLGPTAGVATPNPASRESPARRGGTVRCPLLTARGPPGESAPACRDPGSFPCQGTISCTGRPTQSGVVSSRERGARQG